MFGTILAFRGVILQIFRDIVGLVAHLHDTLLVVMCLVFPATNRPTNSKFHKHTHVVTNKHVALKLRLKFFESVLFPTVLFGLATLPLSNSQLLRLDVTQRKMLRTIVRWVAVESTDWKTKIQRMNGKLDAPPRLYPIRMWSDAVFKKQFRLSARVCRHLERWPAAATFWNPPDKAEEFFTNQPFWKHGRPQVRWDDILRKFGEMQFQTPKKKKHCPFLLDILPYGVLLKTNTSSFVVKRLHCKLMVLICLVPRLIS